MASANKLLYQVSTALVVLLFALAGTMKLIPNLSPETHGELVRRKFQKRISVRGAIFEKRYDAHPPSWLVVWASQQNRSQKLGDFFAGKSLDSGSTSGRGCLISNYMYAL